MGIPHVFLNRPLRVLAAALLVAAWLAPAAQAAPQQPKALATLDVCEDLATGAWVYSGAVSLAGTDAATAKVDYLVQNRVNGTGYADVYRAQTAAGGKNPEVRRFSIAAAPRTLGSLRGAAKVSVTGVAAQQVIAPFSGTVCGCNPVKGCVRTQGYWGNKPGVAWPAPYSRSAMFFSGGLTAQQVFDTPPRGSGYLILAKQYLAAVLNYAAGASAPPSIITAIDQAAAFFASGTTPASCGPGQCHDQIALGSILDTHNNGEYPGAPKHCD